MSATSPGVAEASARDLRKLELNDLGIVTKNARAARDTKTIKAGTEKAKTRGVIIRTLHKIDG